MRNSKDLSVIIVNFRSEHYLKKCLASVYNKLDDPEIIIVNNDLDAGLTEVRKLFPEIKIIDQKKNIGFGAANNLGVRAARGEILFFLNPDTEVLGGKKESLLENFFDENVGCVAPRLLRENNEAQEWSVGFEITPMDTLRNNLGLPKSRKLWTTSQKTEADWASGAALLIRKSIFNEIGGFDEKFFMYFEDVDLCRRVKGKNKKIIYFPDFTVKHLCGGSVTNRKGQKESFYRSQDYYFEKHFGKLRAAVLKGLRKIFN